MSEGKLFSLGIEEEFQIIDPQTRELKSHIQQILEEGKMILQEQVKAEMHQSVVETGSNICENIKEARVEVTNLRRKLAEVADDKEKAIHVMNAARYFLPHIFALSTNSPFWKGRNTGFKSYRAKIFDRFPRTGIPDHFNSYGEYESYVNLLIKTGCIDNAKRIWWDIRLHPIFDTLEVRICDVPMRVDETIALAALIQAVIAKLYKLLKQNLGFRLYRRLYINENKWRASRYGLEGKMIDFGKQSEVPTPDLIHELLAFVDDVVDELGSREEINYVHEILKMGTGARRQLKVWNDTASMEKVVDLIIEETNMGLR